MTGLELKQFTEDVVLDGTELDDDVFYPLLNVAKTKLEEKNLWQYLIKLDSTKTAAAGNNYQTGYDLPTDFAYDLKLLVGTSQEYFPINFMEQHLHRNSARRYYIDNANEQYFLTGNVNPGGTIYLYYKRFTPDIEEATSPVFPARFHKLLGFYVAGYYQGGIDADDVFARMSPENKIAARELELAMMQWDNQLAARAQNHRVGVAGSEPMEDLANM